MAYCQKCRRSFSDHYENCPNCNARLTPDKREGWKAGEAAEYAARKGKAVLMVVLGIIIVPVAALFAAFSGDGGVIIICSFYPLAAFLILYGLYYWKKVNHIIWTRQALREFGVNPGGTTDVVKNQSENPMNYSSSRDLSKIKNLSKKEKINKLEQLLLSDKITEKTYLELKEKYDKQSEEEDISEKINSNWKCPSCGSDIENKEYCPKCYTRR